MIGPNMSAISVCPGARLQPRGRPVQRRFKRTTEAAAPHARSPNATAADVGVDDPPDDGFAAHQEADYVPESRSRRRRRS
jgi:hypothetical protein